MKKFLVAVLLIIFTLTTGSVVFAIGDTIDSDTTVDTGTTAPTTQPQPTRNSFSCSAKNAAMNTASITVQPSNGDMQSYSVSLYTAQGTQYASATTNQLPPNPPVTAAGATYTYSGLSSGTTYYAVIVGTNLPPQQIPGCSLTTTTGANSAPGTLPAATTGTYTFGTLGSVPTTPINATIPVASTIVATPQTGSTQLAQCSAIKFISLLDILIWLKCIIVIAIIPLIFAAAFMFFLWGVMKFIMANDSAKKEEGKKFIIAGMIGLFVMTSIWGIVSIVSRTLGTGSVVPILQTSSLQRTP